jgi:PAS domain S-box-containing protein
MAEPDTPSQDVHHEIETLRDRVEELGRALHEAESRGRLLAHAPFEGIFILEEGIIQDASPALVRILGYDDVSDLVGRDLLRDVATADSARRIVGHMSHSYQGVYEAEAKRKDGTIIPIEVKIKQLEFEEHTFRVGSITDITDRRRRQREQVRLERLSALGEISAGMSHNLNNLLTSVLMPAERILEVTKDSMVADQARTILAAGSRAAALISRLRRSVKGEHEEPHPLRLRPVVEEAVQTARPRWKDEAEARGVVIRVDVDVPEDLVVSATETGLLDAILNLLFNAVDALPYGGTVEISAAAVDDGVALRVRDDGTGMRPETSRRIFEPFFTTKTDVGTGLGLSSVLGSMQGWGGRVTVETAPGEGTTITLHFPPVREAASKPGGAHAAHRPRTRARILLVEDEAIMRDMLRDVLGRHHELDAVSSGEEAIAGMRDRGYDLVLIDYGMPGMRGDAVARAVKAADSAVTTVMITGWDPADVDAGDEFDLRIQKPFGGIETLLDLIEEGLELRDERLAGRGG